MGDRATSNPAPMGDRYPLRSVGIAAALLFLLQGPVASSPEFDLGNTVFLFPGSRMSNHRTSPAELASPCVDEVSLLANGQGASIDERPMFLRRLVSRASDSFVCY